jgi:hypothetical protein
MQIDLLDMGLRTHEILEYALQFQPPPRSSTWW